VGAWLGGRLYRLPPALARPRKTTPKSPELGALGAAVRELREERGWTQEQLADQCRGAIDAPRIGRTELGQRNLTYLSLVELSRAFGIGLDQLMARVEKHLT
jgi:transcriptional regulator with XRE-family HTH domain